MTANKCTNPKKKRPVIIRFRKSDAVNVKCAETAIFDRCVCVDFDGVEKEPIDDIFLQAKRGFEVIVRDKR